MERDRPWQCQHDGLSVETQRTLTLRRSSLHPYGFRDELYLHIPYDTFTRLHRLKPDVIISDELGVRSAQALIYRCLHAGSRLIIWATISEHTEQGRGLTRRQLRRVLLSRADAILVNGASGARYVKRFGVADETIFVAPQTTDSRRFFLLPLEKSIEQSRRLLYLGRLIQLKNLAPFMSVLSVWCSSHPEEKVEFWIVGDGPEREKLATTVYPPNLKLRFWGNVAYEALPAFYAQAGILVFPTLADTWGLVVNEAMAAGLTVLGSVYSQAVEDLIEDGVNGWTFRPDCRQEMYAALDRALVTPVERWRQMGGAARAAVQHLTPEFAADRIMDAISFVSGAKASTSTRLVETISGSEIR